MIWYARLDPSDVPPATRHAGELGVRRASALHGTAPPEIVWVREESMIERRWRVSFEADWEAWSNEQQLGGWFDPATPDRVYLVADRTDEAIFETASHEVDHRAQHLAPETGPVLAFSWPGERHWEAGEQRARDFGLATLAGLPRDPEEVTVRLQLGPTTVTTVMNRAEAERRGVEIVEEEGEQP